MRYYCKLKEQRRLRIYEKALDSAATSPFARGVQKWILAGAPACRLSAFRCLLQRGGRPLEVTGLALRPQ